MNTEEAYPEAAAILRDAGWKPHDGWNVYTRDTLVMGFQPDGQAFHVKNWAAIQEGHPQWTSDTPDTAEEAAAWLVARFAPPAPEANPLSLDALPFDMYEAPDEVPEHPESEAAGSAAEEVAGAVDLGDGAAAGEGEGIAEHGDASGGGTLQPYDGQDGSGYSERDYAFDADFEEAGELDDLLSDADLTELPAPEPEDFAPSEFTPEPEPDQARFYGLDDLDRVRSLRIGDVATEALRLTTMIEQIVSEAEGEFASIQAYVVSHLDKHTGAFTPQDDQSRQTYARFLELSSARSKITLIDQRRREATAQLLVADRDEVVAFDVAEAFR